MPHDGQDIAAPALTALAEAACVPLGELLDRAVVRVREAVSDGGKVSAAALEERQAMVHGLAWLATYVESLRQMAGWAGRLQAGGRLGEMEALILRIGFGEYLTQIAG
ncbi:MAG: acyl-CoA dehydrogenase, partial [Gemmobacter sp.]